MQVTRHVLEPFARGEASDLHDDVSLVAHVAFGKANRKDQPDGEARHLALLPNESLELDLSDPAQRQLGDYELLELIGEGGMGVVYRARQISLDREVAIKLLAAGPWASIEFVRRFQREAQNAARMQHPNIVAIYEVGDTEELHFFSMRLVRGPSLAAEIRSKGRMSPMRAAQTLRVIAEAVDYAHRLGVLHLDLKPANVLIDENGAPHVADFGLARRLEQGLAAESNEVSGTPSYMAPEQATGGAHITPATDIWGLGAVLYELVTGEPPFLANSAQATLRLVVEGSLRSPRRHVPELPLDMEAIIRKCMTRDVHGRYATARDLADDLTRFIEGREVRARPLNAAMRTWRWARREPKLAVTAVLALVALIVGIAATTQQWRRAEEQRAYAEEQKQRAEQSAAASNRRLWASRRETALRLEKDGNGFEALPQLLANIDEQELSGQSAALERREFGTLIRQGVTLIDRMIIPDANPMTVALSPDGSLMAVALNDMCSVRWYDTATLKERGRVDLSDNPTSDGAPRVPQTLRFIDNHRLVVTLEWYEYSPNPSESDSQLIDLDRAEQIRPPAAFKDLTHTTFSPDGRYAMLFSEQREQFWQVGPPWEPLSPAGWQIPDSTLPYAFVQNATRTLRLRGGSTDLERFEPRDPSKHMAIVLPAHEAMTAWTTSGSGTQVALGDADGQVFITDLVSLKTRQLPLTSGRPVTWLAFSEDDAWIAAVRRDGTAFAFDVGSGMPLHSGQLQHEFALRHVAISHRDRLLIASGSGDTALWRLPLPGAGGVPATRLTTGPTRSARAARYWSGASIQAGLLATADFDGEVRLWRLPRLAMRPEEAPHFFSDRIEFDGMHVVDVEFDQLRVASLRDPSLTTAWTRMPGAILFAELVDQGKTLVAVSRHSLHMLDAATMRPRHAPLPLAGDPLRLAVDASGTHAVLAFPQSDATGFRERIESIDLVTGTARADSASVHGPLRRLVFSPDATQLLAVGPPDGATEVLDATSLHRLGVLPHDPERPVLWADFAGKSSLWLVARSIDDAQGDNAELTHWKIGDNAALERRNVPGIWPVGLMVLSEKPVVAGRDRLIREPGAASASSSPRLLGDEGSTVLATSHDLRVIAHASGRDVQIYDAATLTPIGAPLRTDIGLIDGIAQLAFSSDDRLLLCRTLSHHWLLWDVGADQRPAAELRRDVELLPADTGVQHILRAPTAEDKARLRTSDPGAWTRTEDRPASPVARLIAGTPVPARPPDLDPLLLDLTSEYTIAPDSVYNVMGSVLPSIRGVPIGVVRIQGIDYDMRGAIELRWGEGAHIGSHDVVQFKTASRGIRTPDVPIAAIDIVLFATVPVAVNVEEVYLSVKLHYRDGSSETLPLRTNREVPGLNDGDLTTPIGWIDGDYLRLIGEFRQRLLSNPRLPNPHPERMVSSIDLITGNSWSTPVIFAVTAEPVIAGADIRSTH